MANGVNHSATEPLLRKQGKLNDGRTLHGDRSCSFGLSVVFVFPLPSSTTGEEEDVFRKQHLRGDHTFQELFLQGINDRHLRSVAEEQLQQLGIASLSAMRAAAIEMFQQVFESVFHSHKKAYEEDDDGHDESIVFTFSSRNQTMLFMCVKLSEVVAESFADMVDYPVQLDDSALSKLGIKITGDTTPAFVKFKYKNRHLFRTYPAPGKAEAGAESHFRQKDRIRLIYDKVSSYLRMSEFERLGLLLDVYPHHHNRNISLLKQSWANVKFTFNMTQPIHEVRNYFGEEMALYFLFSEHAAEFLLWLLPIGLLVRVLELLLFFVASSSTYQWPVAAFGLAVTIWFFLLVKTWKRKERLYANFWGSDRDKDEYKVKQTLNPKFEGDLQPWAVDENLKKLLPNRAKQRKGWILARAAQAAAFIFVSICVVGIQYFAERERDQGNEYAYYAAGFFQTVQMKVFNIVWEKIAWKLAEYEEHVTMHKLDRSKLAKTVFMQFFNGIFAFYYIAFFKQHVNPSACPSRDGCWTLLCEEVIVAFLTYIAFGSYDVIVPYVSLQVGLFRDRMEEAKKLDKHISFAMRQSYLMKALRGEDIGKDLGLQSEASVFEEEFNMMSYTTEEKCGDYTQITFPLAFIALFGMAMPFTAALLAFLLTLMQLRADAWKLCTTYRRPYPEPIKGIGMWRDFIESISNLSLLTVPALIVTQLDIRTMVSWCPSLVKQIDETPTSAKVGIAFFICSMLWLTLDRIDHFLPDDSEYLELERKRQDHQRSRLRERVSRGHHGEEAQINITADKNSQFFRKQNVLSTSKSGLLKRFSTISQEAA